jgi:hypothetical protein
MWDDGTEIPGQAPVREYIFPSFTHDQRFRSMRAYIAEMIPDLDEDALRRVADSTNTALRRLGLVIRPGQRIGIVFVIPWPEGLTPRQLQTRTMTSPQTQDYANAFFTRGWNGIKDWYQQGTPRERQAVRDVSHAITAADEGLARVGAEDVISSYDPSILKSPEPNPESVMAYVTAIRNVVVRMAADLAKERAMREELGRQLKEARDEGKWGKVVEGIEGMDWTVEGDTGESTTEPEETEK